MLDWRKITADVAHALTLDDKDRAEFLRDRAASPDVETVRVLINRARAATNFLATSMPDRMEDANTLPAGTLIGSWRIESHIGRGGMGNVYRAGRADGLYEQVAALKMIQGVSPMRARMFEAERRRLALMDHPGIARIIDGGTGEDGQPYMVMDYVDGVSVTQHAEQAKLPRADRLRLFTYICAAVSHAHSRLILHRDIKAANVLVDRERHPRLIDFGISSDLEAGSEAGGPLTFATAAPEQLKGELVSVQTDIFALGVLLHELLTGELPIRTGEGGMEVDRVAIANADLAAILSRAMATMPEDRYGSVSALEADIAATLAHRPVSARRAGWAYAASKFPQRYPAASMLGAATVLSLAAGLVVSLKFASDARAEAQRANAALAEAEYQYEFANANLVGQNTYGTILYDLFAEEGRAEVLTETLVRRWRTLHDMRDQSPELAASVSFAVGRNFFLRRDHANAQQVLGPWLEADYGPDSLRATGREFYAMSLFESGRRVEALPIMRQVMQSYEEGHKRPIADQLNFALRLATLTNAPEDIDKAEALYNARAVEQAGTELSPAQEMNQLAGLMHISHLRKDYAGALQVARDIVSIYDANPEYTFGRTLARINLAELLFYTQDDAAGAEAEARKVLGIDLEAEGESAVTARGHLLLSRSLIFQGRLEEASGVLRSGAEVQERYTGLSGGGPDFELARAEWFAASGDAGSARQVLEAVSGTAGAPDRALIAAYIDLRDGRPGDEVAGTLAGELAGAMPLNYRRAFMYRRLVALGMPDTPEAP